MQIHISSVQIQTYVVTAGLFTVKLNTSPNGKALGVSEVFEDTPPLVSCCLLAKFVFEDNMLTDP